MTMTISRRRAGRKSRPGACAFCLSRVTIPLGSRRAFVCSHWIPPPLCYIGAEYEQR